MRDNDNDSTVKKRSETVSIYVKNNLKNEDSDFSEVVLKMFKKELTRKKNTGKKY